MQYPHDCVARIVSRPAPSLPQLQILECAKLHPETVGHRMKNGKAGIGELVHLVL